MGAARRAEMKKAGPGRPEAGANAALRAWAQRETARRAREENPERPARLRPLEDFSDEYADPTRYRTVDQRRVGRNSATLDGLIAGECCGWPNPPTTDEVYEAMRTDNPTSRQRSMVNMVLRADFETLFGGWMEGAFTWRQVARGIGRRACPNPQQIHAINRTAKS